MARVSCQVRRILDVTKRDPSPVSVTLRDESPPDGKFDFTDFLNSSTTLVDKISGGRDFYKGKSDFTLSQSSLSSLARDKREESNSENDVDLFDFLITVEPKIRDQKPADTSTFAFKTCSNSMKLKDNSEPDVGGLLSDLISIQEYNPSVCSGRSVSPVCTFNLSDIAIPDLCPEEDLKVSSGRNINSCGESDFNFSDILSTICIDDCDGSSSKPLKESTQIDLCLDDFKIDEVPKLSTKKAECGIDISQNWSFDCIDDNFIKETSRRKPGNDGKLSGNRFKSSSDNTNNVGGAFYGSPSNEKFNLDGFNIQDIAQDVNVRNDSSLGTSVDSTKSNGFSFFCDPSENQLTFAEMLDEDSRNVNKAQRKDSSSDQGSISMMDFFKSIQSSKDILSSSESSSSGFFSDEIEKKDSLTSDADDDGEVMVAIDLSTCIKSFEDKTDFNPPLQTTENDVLGTENQSPSKDLSYDNHVLCLPLRNYVIPSQAPRMNLKQSLFSKALSCKSKKDPVLAEKVANIKAELFNEVFGRSVPVNDVKNPVVEAATYSDKCIIQCNVRRNFPPSNSISCVLSIS